MYGAYYEVGHGANDAYSHDYEACFEAILEHVLKRVGWW